MNKLKKVTIYLILFLTLVVGANTIKITKVDADSGFDSSYDSGGSSWGGSSDSWDSSSSWDSSDSSSGSGKPASLTSLMIVVVLFIVVFVIENEISKRKTEKKQIIKSKDMDLDLISKIDPNLNLYEFKNEAFNIYKDVQEAWMNLDDGKIRTLTTDELYNMYSMQLDTLRVKNEKNIMKEINLVTASLTNLKIENNILITKTPRQNDKFKYIWYGFIVVFLAISFVNIINSPIFSAKSYYNRIFVNETGVFENDVPLVDTSKLPLLDKDSSLKLGDRVMGQMTDLVSQFTVSDLYTQINYNDEITRVTPLEYANVIKYFTNHKSGVPGYIKVNSVTGKTELVRLDQGMKYMPSAILNENLYRKLRFSYLTEIFGEASFEIDNEGNPYWIVPTLKYTGVSIKKRHSELLPHIIRILSTLPRIMKG